MVKLEKKFLNKDIKLKELFPPKVKDNYYQVEYKRTGRNFIKQSVGSKIINKYSQYFKDVNTIYFIFIFLAFTRSGRYL